MTKKLFCLVDDGGTDAYTAHFTMNEEFINRLQSRTNAEHGELGVDGDGFHYTTLNVPDECTYESLGITDAAVDLLDLVAESA